MFRFDSLFSKYTLVISLIFISVASCSYGADCCAAAPACSAAAVDEEEKEQDESERAVDPCGICLAELRPGVFLIDPTSNGLAPDLEIPKALRLACGHRFHTECLSRGKWQIQSLKNCPLCRNHLTPQDNALLNDFGLLSTAKPYTLQRLTIIETRLAQTRGMVKKTQEDIDKLFNRQDELIRGHNALGEQHNQVYRESGELLEDMDTIFQRVDELEKLVESLSDQIGKNERRVRNLEQLFDVHTRYIQQLLDTNKQLHENNTELRGSMAEILARLQSLENKSCKSTSSKTRKRKLPISSAAADQPTLDADKENKDSAQDQRKRVLRSGKELASSASAAAAAAVAMTFSGARSTRANKS